MPSALGFRSGSFARRSRRARGQPVRFARPGASTPAEVHPHPRGPIHG